VPRPCRPTCSPRAAASASSSTACANQREQALAAREAALKTLEKTLADEVTHLEGLAKAGGVPVPAGANGAAAAEAAPAGAAGGVTKVYESMKPDEAGPIFDKLDDQVALGILRRMKERQIGAILAAMNRDRAVVMTRLLAEAGIVPR
jgi:flagellar motility protein MotE (MotC chaperone)